MNQDKLMILAGNFIWNFSNQFFIETAEGNFIWNDPDYGGDNTIRMTDLSYEEWIYPYFGRDKGRHIIGDYCKDAKYVG